MDNGIVMDRLRINHESDFRNKVLELAMELAIADARGGRILARDFTDGDIDKYINVAVRMMRAVAGQNAFS